MTQVIEKHVIGDRRSVMQQARLAVRDIYDAIVELVTNADDGYQRLGARGKIEIEIERGRGRGERVLRVRDFADGMTLEVMDEKLSRTGGRVSGLHEGHNVRGTNSRGAKDIASLGRVRFDSIARADHALHSCQISDTFVFTTLGTVVPNDTIRDSVGISVGTGTLVTVTLGNNQTLPLYDTLVDKLQRLVALRDILSNPERIIVLRDSSKRTSVRLRYDAVPGTDRVKETFDIPGYPGARAKLIITRVGQAFERDANRFRREGILVKSRHAVHESTYFDHELESNPHALWFCGRLTCPAIDDLWNDFDERFEKGLEPEASNPMPILDPSRQTGLTREHPFVVALFREALKRLRPLVEQERQREENQRATIESDATRRRLDALEKAATRFMADFTDEDEIAREPDGRTGGSQFKTSGYTMSPPFAQIVVGHAQKFWLSINQEVFPELEAGESVQVEVLTDDISSDRRFATLEKHPQQDGVLRAIWKVTGQKPTTATAVRARVGSVLAESAIEVFATESDRYLHVGALMFARKRYRLQTDGGKKRLRVLAPISHFPVPTPFEVEFSNRHFRTSGPRLLVPNEKLGVSIADVVVAAGNAEAAGSITVRAGGMEATAQLESMAPEGAGIKIKLEDIDLKHQRSIWRSNVLEIAARHPSVSRYLGSKASNFPGQEARHFRVLVAEIVADAVCYRLLSQNIRANPEDYENADWDQYYADYARLFSQFLPIAHKLQCPDTG